MKTEDTVLKLWSKRLSAKKKSYQRIGPETLMVIQKGIHTGHSIIITCHIISTKIWINGLVNIEHPLGTHHHIISLFRRDCWQKRFNILIISAVVPFWFYICWGWYIANKDITKHTLDHFSRKQFTSHNLRMINGQECLMHYPEQPETTPFTPTHW